MRRIRFWLTINAYALLLDVLALVAMCLSCCMWHSRRMLAVAICVMGVFSLYGGIGIHGTYLEKKRIYSTLLRRNLKDFHKDSFREFFGVPCHRLVVRMVLHEIGHGERYGELKSAFYRYPWQRQFPDETKLFVFKTKEEGDRWLLQQKLKNA